jgi:putative tryptophan/tyrosine transport system substrate-binding protein
MKRREFIAGLGGTVAWPQAARAQQSGRVRRVGFLSHTNENNANVSRHNALFAQGLEELGSVNGRNLRVDIRWAGGNVERMRTFVSRRQHHRR